MKKNSLFLYFICLIATMGGLMFGFDVAIISGAVPLYNHILAGMNSSLDGV